jgi:outer membrane protein
MWATEKNAWDQEAQTKEQELNELVADYDKQKLILSDEKKKEREATIRTKKDALDAYTRQVYGPGGTAERKEAELIEPLLTKIRKAMELVATENSFDVIFTLQGIGYIKEQYDVTELVLTKLNEIE